MRNSLYFGDNLDVLRESIASESVDLIYLDPPFNSARDYNILFASPKGQGSEAQITAFEDSWHWAEQAEREFGEIVRCSNTHVSEIVQALRRFLGENDMMAYLTMMANRLLELHRVLKPAGSIYLHCDPTASHYLKIVLDGIFGKKFYLNEVIWKRTTAKSQSFRKYPNNHDTILFYTASNSHVFHRQFTPYSQDRINQHYSHIEEKSGRRYALDNLTAAGTRNGSSGEDWRGLSVRAKGNHWKYTLENLEELDKNGRIYWPEKDGGMPRLIRFLDEQSGVQIDSVWVDLAPLNSQAAEALGYPTQKPLALLERIIAASSNPGDVVMDPFCGCGTAVHAAQKLGRNWIGIDITHLAVSLIEKRLKDGFPGIEFDVFGTPKDHAGATDLALRDKYQFQWWACSLVNAQPFQGKKKGSDGGIDGLIYFQDDSTAHKKIVVSVKGGDSVSVAMVRDLAHVVAREKAEIGLFVTLAPATKPMLTEAIKEGFYTSPVTGKAFPKLQILTIEGLLAGTERALYPDLRQGSTTFKKARVEEKPVDQKNMF